MTHRLVCIAVCLLSAVLIGCYEPVGIAYHEPGVYKGKADPLLDVLQTPAQQQVLVERFRSVQTDR